MIERKKLEEEIRRIAYEIYVQSGCIPGRDLDNWLEAERIVLAKYGIKESETMPQDKPSRAEKQKRKAGKKLALTKKGAGRGKGRAKGKK
uniref:DUF2934 domain-containing protein n=1 Tax=Thermodesulfovibrio aggregans TaxID=86166 RepID=A0A7C4AJA9_9BACT